MKKIFAISVAVVLLLAIAILPSFASVESDMQAQLGAGVASPKFKINIHAPATYKPGSSISVTVTVDSITDDRGVGVMECVFTYDASKLTLTTPIVSNELQCISKVPSKQWEGMSHKIEDGKLSLVVFAIQESDGMAKKDGEITLKLDFDVKSTASGDLGFCVPNSDITVNTFVGFDTPELKGNGSYAICAQFIEATSSKSESSAPESSNPESSKPESSIPESSAPDNSSEPDNSDHSDLSDGSVDESSFAESSVGESSAEDDVSDDLSVGVSKTESDDGSKPASDKSDTADDGEKNIALPLTIAIVAAVAAAGVIVVVLVNKKRA